MDWWNAPTKIKEEENWNWLGLDAGDLLAFEHYTRKKYDRHNWGMVLQRQLLTEIGALKIVQDYLEKKQMAALGDKSKKKDGKDGKDKKKKQRVEEEDEAAIVQNADFAPELQ